MYTALFILFLLTLAVIALLLSALHTRKQLLASYKREFYLGLGHAKHLHARATKAEALIDDLTPAVELLAQYNNLSLKKLRRTLNSSLKRQWRKRGRKENPRDRAIMAQNAASNARKWVMRLADGSRPQPRFTTRKDFLSGHKQHLDRANNWRQRAITLP